MALRTIQKKTRVKRTPGTSGEHIPARAGDTNAKKWMHGSGAPAKRLVFSQDFCVRMDVRSRLLIESCLNSGELEEENVCALFPLDVDCPKRPEEWKELSCDGQRMMDTPNAGGSSAESELLALETLRVCFGARLLFSECELMYWPEGSKITDFSVQMYGYHLGVSVTRACLWGGVGFVDNGFDEEQAVELLTKKLIGIHESTKNVCNDHWNCQILFIFAYTREFAEELQRTFYTKIDKSLTRNTMCLIAIVKNKWMF